jgi:hypothetical protein
LINATPEYVAALNLALQYGNTNPNVSGILGMAIGMNPIIMFNPPNNPLLGPQERGQDLYGHLPDGTPVIMWNPSAASVVWNIDALGNKIITGIQSAAQGLFHELIHLLDPAQSAHHQIHDPEYDDLSERTAVTIESVLASDMGEPVRNNHSGDNSAVNNPTLHTITTEDGALQLTWMDAAGTQHYGPQISIGSPEWNNLQQYGNTAAGQPTIPRQTGPIPVDAELPGYPNPIGSHHGDGAADAPLPSGPAEIPTTVPGDGTADSAPDPTSPWNPNPGAGADPFLPPTGPFSDNGPGNGSPAPSSPDNGGIGGGDSGDPDHSSDPVGGWGGEAGGDSGAGGWGGWGGNDGEGGDDEGGRDGSDPEHGGKLTAGPDHQNTGHSSQLHAANAVSNFKWLFQPDNGLVLTLSQSAPEHPLTPAESRGAVGWFEVKPVIDHASVQEGPAVLIGIPLFGPTEVHQAAYC